MNAKLRVMLQSIPGIASLYYPLRDLKHRFCPTYFSERTVLLEELKGIYFPVSKTASTSLKEAIAEKLGVSMADFSDEEVHQSKLPFVRRSQIQSHYLTHVRFGVVRHPLDRLVSAYANKVEPLITVSRKKLPNCLVGQLLSYGLDPTTLSFPDFVRAVSQIPDSNADCHIKSQSARIFSDSDKSYLSHTIRFESLESGLNEVCDALGMEPLVLKRRMTSNHAHWENCYDASLKKIATKRYERDFDLIKF